MTIAPMLRVTICGATPDKAAALDDLQALGVMHVIPLAARDPLAPDDPALRRRADTAFRHISEGPEQLRPFRADADFDAEATIAAIIANRLRLRALAERSAALEARIAALRPFGDFAPPRPEEIGGQRLWLYLLPLKERRALARIDLPWAVVGRTNTALKLAVVAADAPPRDLLPVPPVDPGEVPLSAFVAEAEAIEIDRERAEMERAELTRWRILLGARLAASQDLDDLRRVTAETLDAGEIFAVQGWVPADAAPAVEALAAERGLAVLIEPPAPQDAPPTLLRPRNDRLAIGADLTNFYATPGYRAWDPSLIVFASFAVFFAMIVADAGYAALFLAGTALTWRRMGASPTGARARVLLLVLSGAALVYGALAGSYFGAAPPPGSLLDRLAVVDVSDFGKMMRLSIVIGALHIGLALATVAWLNRGHPRAIAALGWIGALAGGLAIFLSGGATGFGLPLLLAGLAAVFWGSAAARPIAAPRDWLLRAFDGLIGLTGVTKLFGDILSYLRLFALGLASASLAATFNGLAAEVRVNAPGLGVLLALLILLVGHSINVAIGVMGGVVHGLRLNYVEFFGWGLSEEGYPFRAFAKRESPA